MRTDFRPTVLSLLVLWLLMPSPVAQSEEPPPVEDEEWEEWQAEFEELERELETWLDSGPVAQEPISLLSVEAGLGYDDNVLLSSVNRQGSAFLHTGADYLWWSGARFEDREARLFLFGHNRTFLADRGFSDERAASLNAEFSAEIAPDWDLILPLDVFLVDEFTDVSTLEEEFDAVRVRGGSLTFQPGLRFRATDSAEWRGRVIARHRFFKSPLDDHRDHGAGLTLHYTEDANTTLEIDLSMVHRRYATREALESDGETIEGRRLEFVITKFEGTLTHSWGSLPRWRSRTSGGFDLNRDNGGGYFDFIRPFVSQRISYRRDPWKVEASARASHYNFRERVANDNNGSSLYRNAVDLGLKGEYAVTARLALIALYNHNRIDSNERNSAYRVNTVMGGIEATF